jgi:ATP-binding cassette subfamily F protein uup
MALVSFEDVSLEFGDQPLLIHAHFAIEPGERVCLIGRNGAGKSSMLKLITGQYQQDHGDVRCQSDIRISQLEQSLLEELDESVYDFVSSGLAELQNLIDLYRRRSREQLDKTGLLELENLQHRIETQGGWHIDQRIETILTDLNLPAERRLREISSGWRRRAALAKALVCNPDLLLLDEPTNHLDLSTLQWLENKVDGFPGSVLFITHDRAFIQRLATRIVELDRGRLTSWPGDYRNYQVEKVKALEDEVRHRALFDKRLAHEEAWIRQGIKARRTRNEGRVRALAVMREEYSRRVKPQSKARITVEEADRSGRKVIELRNITHGYKDEPLIRGLSLKIMRGDRIGLIGNNGVGKSTLLRIMLGEIAPNRGTVKLGTNLEIGYFDQLRRELDPEKTIAQTIGDGSDYVKVNGRDRHVIGYLKGFLFTAKRAMTPVKALSGGECNRIVLARLFTRPTNLLVLDEPTSDLDVETLEVLEERLSEYEGTLVVVSHDREFLDRVVTSTLVFEDAGKVQAYVGGYSDWLRRGRSLTETDNPKRTRPPRGPTSDSKDEKGNQGKKLSYKLKLELEQLPDKIEALEKEVADLEEQTVHPDFYTQPFDKVQPVLDRLTAKQSELEQAIERWLELETMH